MSSSASHGRRRRSTDASAAAELEIGPRLASYRTQRGIKVSALARAVGVSASLISQIERGQSRPSVSTLLALAETLDVPMDAFFRDAHDAPRSRNGDAGEDAHGDGPSDGAGGHVPRDGPVGEAPSGGSVASDAGGGAATRTVNRYLVRRDARAAIAIEGGVRWERLTPTQLPEIEFMELVYGPGAESHASQYRHPGIEMVVMLEGRMDIDVASERYELGPGDSLCFPSSIPHRYSNPTGERARAVTVILPDAQARAAGGPP